MKKNELVNASLASFGIIVVSVVVFCAICKSFDASESKRQDREVRHIGTIGSTMSSFLLRYFVEQDHLPSTVAEVHDALFECQQIMGDGIHTVVWNSDSEAQLQFIGWTVALNLPDADRSQFVLMHNNGNGTLMYFTLDGRIKHVSASNSLSLFGMHYSDE